MKIRSVSICILLFYSSSVFPWSLFSFFKIKNLESSLWDLNCSYENIENMSKEKINYGNKDGYSVTGLASFGIITDVLNKGIFKGKLKYFTTYDSLNNKSVFKRYLTNSMSFLCYQNKLVALVEKINKVDYEDLLKKYGNPKKKGGLYTNFQIFPIVDGKYVSYFYKFGHNVAYISPGFVKFVEENDNKFDELRSRVKYQNQMNNRSGIR